MFTDAVRLGPPGQPSDSGSLAVSGNGLATVVFGSSASRFGYSYITSRRGGPPSASRKIDTRVNLSGRRDALLELAPLSRGRVAMLWSEIWPTSEGGGGWRRLRVKIWHPKQAFEWPRYTIAIPPRHIPFPSAIATSKSGSWIAWWQQVQESEAQAKKVPWVGR